MESSSVAVIRPASRHIFTIGEGLIKDKYTALVELVKNSYDADARNVTISFSTKKRPDSETNSQNNLSLTSVDDGHSVSQNTAKQKPDSQTNSQDELSLTITDDGHGMSLDTVTNIWMVPSTPDKEQRTISPELKRPMQGRKGIGRYAVSILGSELYMSTVHDKAETSLMIDWESFLEKEYLDEVEILLETVETNSKNGTLIEITGTNEELNEWDEWQIDNLIRELRKLLSPIQENDALGNFNIDIEFGNFPVDKYSERTISIEPYPIVDLFDYRISGEVDRNGNVTLVFQNQLTKGIPDEHIPDHKINLSRGAYCGNLKVDFRVFDRDSDSIGNLINRGLTDPDSGRKLGKREARRLLDEFNGIGVYRSGFRIRPHGDPGYDWLQLDRDRVQNPSMRIGSDQVIGFISIEPEEISNLIEKANREGLKENKYYTGLVEIAKDILRRLEARRFDYKRRTGKSRIQESLTDQLDMIFDFSTVTQNISRELEDVDISKKKRESIVKLLSEKAEESNRIVNEVKQTIALYQGQVTLGKIVKVILHEARNPLTFFTRTVPVLTEWVENLRKEPSSELLDKLSDRLIRIREQSTLVLNMFGKIEPLAAKRRKNKSAFNVNNMLHKVVDIFSHSLLEQKIELSIKCDDSLEIKGWVEDFNITIANLLDNSIFWLRQEDESKRRILIQAEGNGEEVLIDYYDSGPGIEEKFIESEVIFEPGFSTKKDGTGLGLAIAGEAMQRNDGELKALYTPDGAHFHIQLKK